MLQARTAEIPTLTFHDGTYHRVPTDTQFFHSQEADLQQVASRRAEIMRLCAPAGRASKLKGISTTLGTWYLGLFFGESKCFPYAIANNGPIEAPALRYIFKKDPEQLKRNQLLAKKLKASDYNFPRRFSRLYLDLIQRDRSLLIEGQMSAYKYPDDLSEQLDDLDQFTKDFFAQRLPSKLIYKPNFGSSGRGVLSLELLDDGTVQVQALNNDSSNDHYLLAYSEIESQDIDIVCGGQSNGRKMILKLNNNQETHLKNIIDLTRVEPYKPYFSEEDLEAGRRPDADHPAVALVDYGMVQDYHELLKTEGDHGQIVEGRYRFNYEPEGKGFSIQKSLNDDRSEGSYLKVGTNDSFVNQGDEFIAWDQGMHSVILEQFDLEDSSQEFDQYMEKLLESQVRYYIEAVRNSGLEFNNTLYRGEIDIAWSASETMLVQLPDSDKTIRVPKPMIMEVHFRDRGMTPFQVAEDSTDHSISFN